MCGNVRLAVVIIIRYLQAIKTMKCVKIKISNLIGERQISFYIQQQIPQMEISALSKIKMLKFDFLE